MSDNVKAFQLIALHNVIDNKVESQFQTFQTKGNVFKKHLFSTAFQAY